MDISNHEISSAIWLSAFLCWSMLRKEVRGAARSLAMTFLQWKILVLFSVAFLYIFLCVSILAQWNIWTTDNLKTTIIWSIGYTFSTLIRINSAKDDSKFFSYLIRDLFTIAALLTFIIELHSFSIIIELIAVPSLALAALPSASASIKNGYKHVTKFLDVLLTIVCALYISISIYMSFIEIDMLTSIATLREFCTPIILSLMFLPFLYLVALLFAYEQAFVRVSFAIKDDKLRRSAKWRALYTFKHDYNALQRWATAVVVFNPQNSTELNNLFAEAQAMAIREANPPVIERSQGWSPYAAMDFLTNEGLRARDYSRRVDNTWSASLSYLEIDSGALPNRINYYLNGTNLVVTELKLILNVNNPAEASSAEAQFVNVARRLLSMALDCSDVGSAVSRVEQLKDFEQQATYGDVRLTRSIWSGGIPGGYSLKLVIRSANHRENKDV